MKSNLALRIISALILAPLVLGAIFFGDPAYNLLIAVMGSAMAWEWEHMITGKISAVAVIMASTATMIAFVGATVPPLALAIIAVAALLVYVKSGKKLLLSFGVFYIGIPMMSLIYIGYTNMEYSFEMVLWLMFVVWATDIGGYVFGKSLGGPKLLPKISPKKTWSGLLGGMLFACVVSYFFILTMRHFEVYLSMPFFVGSSAVLAVISQMGDLFESRIKRYLNIKDSSNLIPGHGGIFDRVDGLLFAAPVVALFLLFSN